MPPEDPTLPTWSVKDAGGPYGIVRRREIALLCQKPQGARAALLWALLATYANRDGGSYPMQDTLAEALDVDVRTIKRAVATLKEAGWLTIEKRRRSGGLPGHRNVYTMHRPV